MLGEIFISVPNKKINNRWYIIYGDFVFYVNALYTFYFISGCFYCLGDLWAVTKPTEKTINFKNIFNLLFSDNS